MKKLAILSILILLISSCGGSNDMIIINPELETNGAVLVTIDASSFLGGNDQLLPLIRDNQDTLSTQFLDLNGDSKWDQVLMYLDFKTSSEIMVTYDWIAHDSYPVFEKKTNVYLGFSENRDNNFVAITNHQQPMEHKPMDYPLRYQSEGPVWESEVIAYRSYFDSRNGKDIFGKSSPDLRAEKIGYNENYHKLQDWGMDVLKVGNSLGAGALALLKNDSLYRLGATKTSAFEIVVNGPLMTQFILTYTGWMIADKSYDLQETISIFAGQKWYRSQVVLLNGNENDTLVTGIVTLKNPTTVSQIKTDNLTAIYTHDKEQGEIKDALGMSLIIPNQNFLSAKDAPKEGEGVVATRLAMLKPQNGVYTYFFTADWEGQDVSFKDSSAFEVSIKEQLKSIERIK